MHSGSRPIERSLAATMAPELLPAIATGGSWARSTDAGAQAFAAGETAVAIEHLEAALAAADGPERQAVAHHNLAEVHLVRGEWAQAAAGYEAALALVRRGVPVGPGSEARSRQRLSEAYLALDRLEEAVREAHRALLLHHGLGSGRDLGGVLDDLELLAEAYRRQGDLLGVVTSLSTALELAEAELGPDSPAAADWRRQLTAYATRGREARERRVG